MVEQMKVQDLLKQDKQLKDLISDNQQKHFEKFKDKVDGKDIEKNSKDIMKWFMKHGDEVLIWLNENLEFNYCKGILTTDDLKLYEDAKDAFVKDIDELKALKPEKKEKTGRATNDDVYGGSEEVDLSGFDKLSQIIDDIKNNIQIAKAKLGTADKDFEATKLQEFVKKENLQEKMNELSTTEIKFQHKKDDFDKSTGALTAAWATKTIENIIDMENPPKTISIKNTKGKRDKETTGTLKKINGSLTYVGSDGTTVITPLEGDIITAVIPKAEDIPNINENITKTGTVVNETITKETNKNALETILAATPTAEKADELFEGIDKDGKDITRSEGARNSIFDTHETRTATQKANFEGLLKLYTNETGTITYTFNNLADENKKTEIDGKKIDSKKYNYIKVTGTNSKETDIMRGKSTDVLHQARADMAEWTWADTTVIDNNITELEPRWSYREFEDILYKKDDPEVFLTELLTNKFLEGVESHTYKEKDGDTQKNGYYGVILDYIFNNKNEKLLTIYLNKIVDGDNLHLKYLWTDEANQIINFNKVVNNDKRPIDANSDNGKMLAKIRLQLANFDKKSLQEAAKQWVDAFFKQFGSVIVDILEFFWGKWAARNFFVNILGVSEDKFDEYFAELDKKYKERFWLSDEQKKILNEIHTNYKPTEEKDKLKIWSETVDCNKTYIVTNVRNMFITDTKVKPEITNGDNFQYLDPVLVVNAAKELKIANATLKEQKNGKIIKKTNNNLEPENKIAIVDYILKWKDGTVTWSETLRKEVSRAANTIMNTDRIYSKTSTTGKTGDVLTSANDRNTKQKESRKEKGIKLWADIALFAWAYLMKGSDNLAYSITETDGLKNEESEAPKDEETKYTVTAATKLIQADDVTKTTDLKKDALVTSVKWEVEQTWTELGLKDNLDKKHTKVKTADGTLWRVLSSLLQEKKEDTEEDTNELNIESQYLATDGTLTGVTAKKIHEIFYPNFASAPEKLIFTSKTEGKTKVNIEKGKIKLYGNEIDTYIYSDVTPKTRVKIYDGDKLEAAEAVAETINTKRTTISTALNATTISTDKSKFEWANSEPVFLDDKNTYQTQIANLSALFLTETNYANLIWDTDQKATLKDMLTATNLPHFKNMLKYRWLKQKEGKETAVYGTDKATIDTTITKMDATYTYDVTSATLNDGIVITAKDGTTEKWTITIKNVSGKVTAEWKDTWTTT